jgi:hypothetical protein
VIPAARILFGARYWHRRCGARRIGTSPEECDVLDGEQRRQILERIFSEVLVDDGRLVSATPRSGWLDYIERTGVLTMGAPVLVGRRRRESNPR